MGFVLEIALENIKKGNQKIYDSIGIELPEKWMNFWHTVVLGVIFVAVFYGSWRLVQVMYRVYGFELMVMMMFTILIWRIFTLKLGSVKPKSQRGKK